MTKYLFTVLLGLFALNFSSSLHASEAANSDGGLSPEIIAALKAINLDAEQKPKFGAAMMEFSASMQSSINRVMRSRKTDKPRLIKRKVKSLFKKLDEPMKGILRDDQWPAYLMYKKAYGDAL